MIEPYLRVTSAIPHSRCAGLLEGLRRGQSFSAAVSEIAFSPGELQALDGVATLAEEDPIQVGLDLTLLYKALGDRNDKTEIVWTGPSSAGLSFVRSTFPVARSLIVSAKQHLIIAGYVAHAEILDKMGVRAAVKRGAKAELLMNDVTWDSPAIKSIIASGVRVIDAKPQGNQMAKFHAKVIVADREAALVTSANFTHLGQNQNVEIGLLVRGSIAANISALLEKYAASAALAASFVS